MFRSILVALSAFVLAPALAFARVQDSMDRQLGQLIQSKQYAAAIEAGKKVLETSPENGAALFAVGYALHAEGKIDEALEYHKRGAAVKGPNQAVCTYNAACALALKGETDAAFEYLTKATAFPSIPLDQYRTDSDLASLRADPRFAEVLAAVGKQGSAQPKFMVYNQTTPRQLTRVAVFGGDACLGQVAIEYGTVAWKPEFGEQLDSGALDGQRWRLGSDFWTNVDASTSFTLGGTRFAAGTYFLVAERTKEGKYLLTVLDAAATQKSRVDAYEAHKTIGGTAVELAHEKSDTEVENLTIKLATAGPRSTKGSLVVSFGPHKLSTPFTIEIEE